MSPRTDPDGGNCKREREPQQWWDRTEGDAHTSEKKRHTSREEKGRESRGCGEASNPGDGTAPGTHGVVFGHKGNKKDMVGD